MDQEQRWIRAIVKRQSRDAADQLVRAYYDEIYLYFYRKTDSREDALDLTQECFISVLQSLSSYDPDRAGFRTWLYRIAMYKAADFWRSRKPLQFEELEDESLQADEEDMSEMLAQKELLEEVRIKAEALKEPERTIVRLHIMEKMRFAEIAELLSQPEANIKSKYYRAIKRLRKEIGHEI